MTLKFDRWPWKTIGHLSFATSRFVHHFIAISKFKLELRSPETLNSGQNRRIFGPCDVEIWPVTLKNNTAPVLYYFKLCASFHSHKWIQTGVRVRKRSIWVKIVDFLAIVTLKFDRWPSKTIGHLSYATTSFVHHFIAISEFKLELRVRKRSIRVKIGDFLSPVTLKFDRWPWKTIGHLFYANSSCVHHFISISEFNLELESGNAQFGSKFVLTSVTLTFDLDLLHGYHFWPW